MPSLEILKAGLMTSIQDLGRKGLAYYAIPKSGVMDVNAAKIALLLLNKSEASPLIECTSAAPHIRFRDATQIVLTGADFNWKLNSESIHRNEVIEVHKGDVLKGQFAKEGLRGYLAIEGDLKIQKIHQSHATYINAKMGGHEGRLLQKGDVIEWENPRAIAGIPIYRGPEFDYLTPLSQGLLIAETFTLGTDSNRMGARLKGAQLESRLYQLENSLPVLPGFIQLPPSGYPIVVLQDGQSTGGYPRIAYIREEGLSRFNQIGLGGEVRFVLVD